MNISFSFQTEVKKMGKNQKLKASSDCIFIFIRALKALRNNRIHQSSIPNTQRKRIPQKKIKTALTQ